MHPEVVSDKPGKCSKCGGMDLVLVKKTAHRPQHAPGHAHNHHEIMAQDFKKRFWMVLPLTIIVLILSPQIQNWLGIRLDFAGREIVLFALGSLIALWGALPFYQHAKGELETKNFGMMTLVSLAVLSGYSFSVAATFLFKGESLWWEMSTLVLAFLFGHWMEMRAVLGTGSALKELASLIPPMAHKIVASNKQQVTRDVETSTIVKGDIVLIKPGEKIPVDGEVVEGTSSVNEAMITGESRPVAKKIGDKVIGGTINNDGSLTVKVTKIGSETALAQIMELIQKAQTTKPSVQKLADRAANWLTITAILVGSATFIYWFALNPHGAVFAATLAITVIVITCPHALGLAIPTVTTITSALAAKNGILIRDMKGLEVARKLNWVIFDKTGTLTKGEFGVADILPARGPANELLKLAAAVEVHSQHSIAKGIIEEAKKQGITIPKATSFRSYPGKGATAKVGDKGVVVGNQTMMEELSIQAKSYQLSAKSSSKTIVYVAANKKLLGVILLEDQVREESKKAIKKLHQMGIKVAMLTGDKKDVADEVGKSLGIDTVFSEVLPEEKVSKVKSLQSQGSTVGTVGDGVNDAPMLTQAHLGIAIGAGTDVAIESAEIVLVKNNPLDVVKIIELSKATDSKMKQNLAWATGYNVLAIPAAAGVFSSLGILLRPEWGALLMSASSIIVVLNALLLRKAKL